MKKKKKSLYHVGTGSRMDVKTCIKCSLLGSILIGTHWHIYQLGLRINIGHSYWKRCSFWHNYFSYTVHLWSTYKNPYLSTFSAQFWMQPTETRCRRKGAQWTSSMPKERRVSAPPVRAEDTAAGVGQGTYQQPTKWCYSLKHHIHYSLYWGFKRLRNISVVSSHSCQTVPG